MLKNKVDYKKSELPEFLKKLSIEIDSFSECFFVQRSVLDAIWTKAGELINDSKAICMVPGGNENDRIVRSGSGPRPHIVTAKKIGRYSCDTECPNFKSLGICSHTVAAAKDNGDLQFCYFTKYKQT